MIYVVNNVATVILSKVYVTKLENNINVVRKATTINLISQIKTKSPHHHHALGNDQFGGSVGEMR